jgi:hypothetical protein
LKKRRIIGILTVLAGLPGLGGFWLIGILSDFPIAATIIVINAILFRGLCGVAGGILIWRGSKWGYYLTLVTWVYLVVVSILTIIQLYNNGIEFSYAFLVENYSSYGRRFIYSIVKIIAGVPIIYLVLNSILKSYQAKKK